MSVNKMEQLGTDFNATGSVMTREELEENRKKRGECTMCGRKCFQKKLFKMTPITDAGLVLNGRCLRCMPLESDGKDRSGMLLQSRAASREDLMRFSRSQSNLQRSSSATRPIRSGSTRRTVQNVSSRSSRDLSRGHGISTGSSHGSTQGAPESALSRGQDSGLQPPLSSHRTPSRSRHRPTDISSDNSSGRSSRVSVMHTRVEYDDDEYDNFTPHQLERKPSGEEIQAAMKRITGHTIDENEVSLDSVGMRAHPTAEALVEFYRKGFRESQRSLHSLNSSTTMEEHTAHTYDSPRRGFLNRGGEIPFGMQGAGGVANGSSRHIPVSSRRLGSSRSIDSLSTMGDDLYSHGTGASDAFNASVQTFAIDSGIEPQLRSFHRDDLNSSDHTGGSRSRRSLASRSHYSAHVIPNPSSPMSEVQVTENPGIVRLRAAGDDYFEIFNILREFPDSPEVQSTGLQMFSNLSLTDEENEGLANTGILQGIIDAMKSFPSDLELQISGCRAMWNASTTSSNQLSFVEYGALDVVLRAMENFPRDADLQEQAMAALANFGAIEANLEMIAEKHTVERIVQTMNHHSDKVELQVKGCTAIANLASHLTTLKRAILVLDGGLNGGQAVVIAMMMHQENPELQERALRALRNLSANCDENKVDLTNLGSIDACINAMQIHRDIAGVQEAGAWTLANLAGNQNSKVLIGECGGIDVIVRAMWVHSELGTVLEWCCRALLSLTVDERNCMLCQEVGGISAVINAMQAHSDSPTVQELGCAILGNLANSDESKMRIVDEEALDVIVLAMVVFSQEPKVQERACGALRQLAIVQNYTSMHASNIVALVQTAAANFPESCAETAQNLLDEMERFASNNNIVKP